MEAKKKIFAKFAASAGGSEVKYQHYNSVNLAQAIQLARQSNQLPDVFSAEVIGIPIPKLVSDGWFQPLLLDDATKKRLAPYLVDGVHIFNGRIYAFPIFSQRSYTAINWFNRDIVKAAGLDPDSPPRTYDEFRKAARAVTHKGPGYGLAWNLAMPDRLTEQVNFMAQAGGFDGAAGLVFTTGEYAYHDDAYVNAIEFLVSLKTDGSLTPGSTGWKDNVARARWTAGAAAYYLDGPWCPGIALGNVPDFADKLGVGPMLVPESNMPVKAYRATQPGDYWLTKESKVAIQVGKLMSNYIATPEYSTVLANTMSQPPRDVDAAAASTAHPAWKAIVKEMAGECFIPPEPVLRNSAVATVQALGPVVQQTLGAIVQGAFVGDISDVRGALKKLSDESSAAREAGITAATAKGAKVILADYAFANWRPGVDFTKDMYKS